MSARPYTISDAFLWALSRRGVTITARNVLAALWCYVDWQGGRNDVWPARHTLAERLGIRRQAVTAAISELASAGLLTREGHGTSRVTLADPDPTLASEPRDNRARHLQANQPLQAAPPTSRSKRHLPLLAAPAATSGTPPAATSGTPTSRYDLHPQPLQAAPTPPLQAAPIADSSRIDLEERTRIPIANPPEPPHPGEGKTAETLALIPPEHVETREPVDPAVEQVIAYHNERADVMNATIDRPADRLQRIRPGARARDSARGKQRDIRRLIADRIEEYGLEVVLDVVRGYSALAVREDEAREWYGRAMYTEKSFAIARGQVVKGTAKRFRSERERAEYIARHAGAQEIPTYAPTIRTVPESGGMIAGTPEWFGSLYPDDSPDDAPRDTTGTGP